MTREETLTRFKSWCQNHIGNECSQDDYQMANNIIALLEQEPCEAVSREAVLQGMYDLCNTGGTLKENPWRDNPHIDAIIDMIENLPSVTPKPAECEDAISREHLLSEIDELMQSPWFNNGKDFYDGTNTHYGYVERKEAVEIVRDLCVKTEPSVTPKQKTLEWVPVKDPYTELPKENRLWVTRDDSGCRWVDTTYYDMTEWLDPIDDVVAYALYEEPAPPTPYKEGASE